MHDSMLKRLVAAWRDDAPTAQDAGWDVVLHQRMLDRWRSTIWITAALIVLVLALSGCALGRLAAGPVAWAQAEAADRAAPKVKPPSPPAAPFYPRRDPMPLPWGSPVAVRGQLPAEGQGTSVDHDGLPFQMRLPGIGWGCELLSAPGAGHARIYEWTCDSGDYTQSFNIHVVLAPCGDGCDAHERDALRPSFLPSMLTDFDQATWYAEGTGAPDIFGNAYYWLAMEHVWAAPPGVLRVDAPAQTLYVAVLASAPDVDQATAQQAINIMRTAM